MKRKVIREGETEEVEEVDKDEVNGEMKEGGEAVFRKPCKRQDYGLAAITIIIFSVVV